MHFLFKRQSFLPGDSRVLPAFGETRVKFTTHRGGDSVSLFILSCASFQDEGTTVVFPYLAPSCRMHSQWDPHMWLRLLWGPEVDSYLFLNLMVAECGPPHSYVLTPHWRTFPSIVRAGRNEVLIWWRAPDSIATGLVITSAWLRLAAVSLTLLNSLEFLAHGTAC